MTIDPAHRQGEYAVRMEWGRTGAEAVAADICVVVDVLSFTTTLTVALERGITVHPYRWKDERAQEYADARDAVLAVGRFEQRLLDDSRAVSLSPAAMARVEGVERIVLPSPNGSAISFAMANARATVVGACLRNADAVAGWLTPRVEGGEQVAVVPAGEQWADGTLRPAVEDLWGAGAVIAGLVDRGIGGGGGGVGGVEALSPEARMAERAFRAARLPDDLHACASGRELAAKGFAEDVAVAAEVGASDVVPQLHGDAFTL